MALTVRRTINGSLRGNNRTHGVPKFLGVILVLLAAVLYVYNRQSGSTYDISSSGLLDDQDVSDHSHLLLKNDELQKELEHLRQKQQTDASRAEMLQKELDRTKKELATTKQEQNSGRERHLNELLEQGDLVKNLQQELSSTKLELKALKESTTLDRKASDSATAEEDELEATEKSKILSEKDKISSTTTSMNNLVGPCKPLEWKSPPEGTSPDLQQVWETTIPWCNVTMAALYTKNFFAGLRNQVMAFSSLVMHSMKDGHNQILLESLRHKDTYGSNKLAPHEALFDVAHWNSFYPQLPRMVHCDPSIMLNYDCETGVFSNATYLMPWAYKTFGNQHFTAYQRYTKRAGPFADPFPHPADLLIKSGALRPHPELRAIGDKLMSSMHDTNDGPVPYMTVHARVEPDMQKHPVCREHKVLNLTSIVEFLETKWKDPPTTQVFLPINRQLLEEEGRVVKAGSKKETNWIAVSNLKELNRLSKEGLWGGRVKVFEFGANALKGTRYEERMSSIGGSILNYHIATNSKIFVGTEISSYSNDLVATRFYRGNFENYFYRPDGLHQATTEESTEPPAFVC